jgi:hypothetical protein
MEGLSKNKNEDVKPWETEEYKIEAGKKYLDQTEKNLLFFESQKGTIENRLKVVYSIQNFMDRELGGMFNRSIEEGWIRVTDDQIKKVVGLRIKLQKLLDEIIETDKEYFDDVKERLKESIGNKEDILKIMKDLVAESGTGADEAIDRLLGIVGTPHKESMDDDHEKVFYQPTNIDHLLPLMENQTFSKDDVFYDLGSGLGRVPILMNLTTGVKAKGVEYESAYAKKAQTIADDLKLKDVQFINKDIREVDISDGTVFFMFNPFTGSILKDTMEKLRVIAEKKKIKIYSLNQRISEPWLREVDDKSLGYGIELFESNII